MARPATSNAQRIDRSAERADALAAAIRAACAESAETNPNDETRKREADAWRVVATLAGNIQRDARLLAGLGRGG